MDRILQYDQIDLAPTKITQRDDPRFGPVTVFHDVPIARTIVQQYEDGLAYKPADELENAAWTAQDRWVVIGRHPDTAIVSSRADIGGRTTNVRFTRGLINSKTRRPEDRGILADLEVFDNKVPPDILRDMKVGIKRDVSIGFFFDQDATPGVIGDDYPQLKGTAYDYIQRNIMIDHTAAALDTGSGRCSFPECGIGADAFKSLVTGDPVGPYETFAGCVAAIMKKNPSYTRKQAEGTCGKMEKQSKKKDEEDFKPTDYNKLSMKLNQEVYNKLIEAFDSFKDLFIIDEEVETDDLVEEEYQGNVTNETLSERAKMHFSISDDEWEALSEEEKEDYISRLPPEKTRAGGEEMSERDCEDCEDEEDEDETEEEEVVEPEPEKEERVIVNVLEDAERIWEDRELIIG